MVTTLFLISSINPIGDQTRSAFIVVPWFFSSADLYVAADLAGGGIAPDCNQVVVSLVVDFADVASVSLVGCSPPEPGVAAGGAVTDGKDSTRGDLGDYPSSKIGFRPQVNACDPCAVDLDLSTIPKIGAGGGTLGGGCPNYHVSVI